MKSLLILLVMIGGSLLPTQVRGVVIELRDQQTTAGANVTLNDLVQSSQGLSDQDLATMITQSPSLGNSQTLTRAQIETLLPAALKQQPVEWSGANACIITRPAVSYGEKDVKQLITTELGRHLPADADFAILEMPNLEAFLIPSGPLETQVELTNGSLRNEWGEATLEFRYQGELAVTKSVRFHWAYTRKVWESADRIAVGDPLASTAFQQIETNILKLPGNLQPVADFPEGKIAAHPLPQGKVLMENDWIEPVLVARNDLVTILYDHHGISITVQAKAMANGVRNQVIAVQNLSSHKIFNARVVDERSLVYDE
jgi:flagella basal body P-ring formation protein FlgA